MIKFYPFGLDANGKKKSFDSAEHVIGYKTISVDWSYNALYGHSGTSYVSVGRQVIVPNKDLIMPGATLIQAKFQFVYFTEGAAAMDIELFDYTTGASVALSEENFPNVGAYTKAVRTDWVTITEGSSYRLRTKRVGGTGANNVVLEASNLILKYTM